MSVIHEKDIQIINNEGRVYPHVQKLPTPLCCFRVMHIRTGTLWIAYCEIMWIVTQFSFWTAESIVRGAFQPFIIIAGFVFTFIQLILVVLLIQGIQKFRLSYIELYMIGVCCRLFIFLSFFLTFLFFFIVDGDFYVNEKESRFFHHHLVLKIGFTATYALLKMYALYTAYRCYSYISRTRRTIMQLTIFNENENNVQTFSSSRHSLHNMLPPSHKCRVLGCQSCTKSGENSRNEMGKPVYAAQIPKTRHAANNGLS
ncbi:unnamed protein product [Caenorhabditis angaria]|uniref:Uncharacterized protein n=1 Tax=Caenorhabditis angaria TaxID=860376 RepID=A0A9P1J5W8_9PELO|nr:unnamed protein product [Caenorhabditis angaria]